VPRIEEFQFEDPVYRCSRGADDDVRLDLSSTSICNGFFDQLIGSRAIASFWASADEIVFAWTLVARGKIWSAAHSKCGFDGPFAVSMSSRATSM